MGMPEAPRQVNSTLRFSSRCASSSGVAAPRSISRYEWSRVRASSLPSRTQYRRESPQCSQVACPPCTTAATTVVRGESAIFLSLA